MKTKPNPTAAAAPKLVFGKGRDGLPRIYKGKEVVCQFGEGIDESRELCKDFKKYGPLIVRAVNLLAAHEAAIKASEKLAGKSANLFNAYRGSGADATVIQAEYQFALSVWHEALARLAKLKEENK